MIKKTRSLPSFVLASLLTLLLLPSCGGKTADPGRDGGGDAPSADVAASNGDTASADASETAAIDSAPTTARIGSAGGMVAGTDVQLVVPAGALTQDVEITMVATTVTLPDGVVARSPILRFSPEGLTFAKPITVNIKASGDTAMAKIYWSKAAGAAGFDALTSQVQTVGAVSVVSAEVSHFSIGFVGAPAPAPGACGAREDALNAMDKAYPPMGAAAVSGVYVNYGPAGELFVSSGGGGSFITADAKTLRPSPIVASTDSFDAANGWLYGISFDVAGQIVQRQGGSGCAQDVHTFAAATSATVLGVGPTGDLLVIVLSPGVPRTTWVARDKGATWTQVASFGEASYASTAVFAPSDPMRIYVGLGAGSSTTPVGMTISRDGGATFTRVGLPYAGGGIFFGSVTSLAVHPTNADLVYAATNGATYKSTDGGKIWAADYTIPTRARQLRFTADGRLWALGDTTKVAGGTQYLAEGLHVRDAAGTTWTAMNGDLPAGERTGFSFALRERAGQPLELARMGTVVWQSIDAGAHWTHGLIGAGIQESNALLSDPTNAQVFYSYTGGASAARFWRTADAGQTWTPALTDSGGAWTGVLGSSTVIAVGIGQDNSFGLRSIDGGLTMLPMTYTGTLSPPIDPVRGLGNTEGVSQLQVDVQPKTAYLHLAPDLWRTEDDGVTWAKTMSPDVGNNVAEVLADPKVPRRLVALRKSATGTLGESELAVSADAGTTWSVVALPAGQLVSGRTLWTVDVDGNVWLLLSQSDMPKLHKLASGTTTWTPATAPPGFGGSLVALGKRLILDDLVSDGGGAWRRATLVSDPYLHELKFFAPRAAPTRVVFQNAGFRSGPLM